MNIQLKKMKLLNFKGIRQFEAEFNDDVTNLFGRNASGKTTLKDAFLWACFGKDSTDRTTFEIKTLDEENNAYERIDHSVELYLIIDGRMTNIRRVFREKWTKKRGEAKEAFDGHIQDFYWDDIPLKENEFKAKMATVINEQLFKLITNTDYFNSLKWQDRRTILVKLAGDVSNADVITKMNIPVTDELRTILESGKSLDEYRKMIAAKKKKLKDELILFPSRIDEANRGIPEIDDFEVLEKELKLAVDELSRVEEMISDKAKAKQASQSKVLDLMNKKQVLSRLMLDVEYAEKSKVQDRKHDRQSAIDTKKRESRSIADKRVRLLNEHVEISENIKSLEHQRHALRDLWAIENDKQIEFNDAEFCCPTCKRYYPTDQITDKKAELIANFNKAKSDLLQKIVDEGQAKGKEVESLKIKLSNIEAEGASLKEQISKIEAEVKELEIQNTRLSTNDESELEKAITENAQYQLYKKERDELALIIDQSVADEETDSTSLMQNKKDLQYQIDTIKEKIAIKGIRENQLARIADLKSQESVMAQELADLENSEFTMDAFIKAKMTSIEDKVNSMFSIAKFKMFEQQINEGEKETCVTLVNGVPYPDLNTASKVQVGIDIINTFSKYYNVNAPIWVDNRESVTNLPETKSQLINLIVSPLHPKLTIGAKEGAALELFS